MGEENREKLFWQMQTATLGIEVTLHTVNVGLVSYPEINAMSCSLGIITLSTCN